MGRLVQRNVRVIFTKATMIRSVLTLTELRDNFEDEKGRTGVPSSVFGEWPGKPRCQRKRSMIMPVHARLHPAQDCSILTPYHPQVLAIVKHLILAIRACLRLRRRCLSSIRHAAGGPPLIKFTHKRIRNNAKECIHACC